jgi:hypothetical protein
VARGVDQIDREITNGEGRDGGLDRDPASPLLHQGVGLCIAVVDAADLVNDAGRVEQSFGEASFSGVYVRQDSQIERSHRASDPVDRRFFLSRWT